MPQTMHLRYSSIRLTLILSATLLAACGTSRHVHPTLPPVPVQAPDAAATLLDTSPLRHAAASVPVALYNYNKVETADEGSWQRRLQQRLDQLCNTDLFATTRLALCVYDLTLDRMLYSVNIDQRMRPASNMKLVTAITALDHLPSDHVYVPQLDKPGWGWCWDDQETGITDFGAKGTRKSATQLYSENREWTLLEVLTPMMKKSDNMLAESVFWQLPDASVAKPTRKDCAARVEQLISRLGLDPSQYTIADGSGVSLYNYLSARLLTMLLRYAYQTPRIYRSLYPSLPIAGVDGTLSGRMKDTSAHGNVHAKTGTVTGVSSLSGYCQHPSGHQLCFSIINQGIPKAAVGRNFQDQVCVVLTSE